MSRVFTDGQGKMLTDGQLGSHHGDVNGQDQFADGQLGEFGRDLLWDDEQLGLCHVDVTGQDLLLADGQLGLHHGDVRRKNVLLADEQLGSRLVDVNGQELLLADAQLGRHGDVKKRNCEKQHW